MRSACQAALVPFLEAGPEVGLLRDFLKGHLWECGWWGQGRGGACWSLGGPRRLPEPELQVLRSVSHPEGWMAPGRRVTVSPSQPSGCSLLLDHHSTALCIPSCGAEHQGPHHEAHGHGARPRGPPHRVEGLECPAVGLGAVPGRAGALLPPPGRAARGPLRCRSVGDSELGAGAGQDSGPQGTQRHHRGIV